DELTNTEFSFSLQAPKHLVSLFSGTEAVKYVIQKLGHIFNAILSKKEELNTLPDIGRKRQQINPKDNFWLVTARTKNAVEAWFKDLAGSKALSSLSKK
ncbi:hypothetical protein L9F63_025700, partial [Diploptera punctata]